MSKPAFSLVYRGSLTCLARGKLLIQNRERTEIGRTVVSPKEF